MPMKVFRVRLGPETFGMATGMVPSCIIVVKSAEVPKMRDSISTQMRAAFKDDPLMTKHVEAGDYTLTEIPLNKEGIY